ncbi:MAG: CaiB/BaiF CoA-transferase family protein, partial [Actinomycetes bacterium]
MSGPLQGVKVLELAGIGPSPYACMLLADLGADILRLERGNAQASSEPSWDLLNRSRNSVAIDLKNEEGRALVLRLVAQADILIEGFRPGVAERLGVGPNDVHAVNPKLVYGRMTGWGQDGPLAQRAGHDINYIALSGALWSIGRAGERPMPPLNLVGDFGGGGMLLAFGLMAALVNARNSGEGQVVDAAMVDGAASLMAMTYSFMGAGLWQEERGTNILDTGAHFYEVYETADAKYVAVGAIEKKFYEELLAGMGLTGVELPNQMDRTQWSAMKERFAAIFKTKTRDEWTAIFEDVDACVTPVLSPTEEATHRH